MLERYLSRVSNQAVPNVTCCTKKKSQSKEYTLGGFIFTNTTKNTQNTGTVKAVTHTDAQPLLSSHSLTPWILHTQVHQPINTTLEFTGQV